MPFVSKAQRAYLEIHHPEVAKEFAAHTSAAGEKDLPEHKDGDGGMHDYLSKHHPDVLSKLPKDTHDAARALRLDRGKLAKAQRTPQGFARVDARLTRTGILEYVRADGSVQREYRPADEVFRADSLESLDRAPVTDLHPSEMVSPANARALSVGVTGTPRRDGQFVAAELQIQDGGTIAKIDAGERAEISCGYTCELDPTPGVFEGQRYDAVQRNIQYNHVAIGPSNWGRAGAEVALRLDSADASTGAAVSRFDDVAPVSENGIIPRASAADGEKRMALKVGNVELKLDERDAQIVAAELQAQQTRLDAAEAKVRELQAQAGAQAVEIASAKKRADDAEARVAKIDRAELETAARVALGPEFKFDGKSDADVKTAVVAKMCPGVRLDGADAAFVAGAYSVALGLAQKAQAELATAGSQSGARSDAANDANDPAKARAEMIAARRDAALSK